MKGKLLVAFFIISSAATSFFAQVLPEKLKQCDAQTARQYVAQQAIESKSSTESDKRINILIRVADYLWDKDNESARKYFAESFTLAVERFKEKGIVNTSNLKFWREEEPDYRFEVVKSIMKRDAEWARKLNEQILKSFDEDEEKLARETHQQDREIGQSLEFAASLYEQYPDLAISVFRRLIKYPLNAQWNRALYRIASKNPDIADQLYSELLFNHNGADFQRFLILSAYPFGKIQTISIMSHSTGPKFQPDFVANTNLQRQFLGALFSKISSFTPETIISVNNQRVSDAGWAVYALAELSLSVGQNFPELKAEFSRASATANALLDDNSRKHLEAGNKFKERFSTSFEDKINALEEADALGTITDYMIVRLIIEVKDETQLKALEKWLDRIRDNVVKEKSVNFFYFKSAKIAIKETRFQDARKFADRVPQIEYRAVLYFDIAEAKLKSPLSRYETLELLTEVSKVAEKSTDSVEKAQVLLGVAYMYQKIDRFNSIDSLSKAIHTANKLENPKLFTSNIMQAIEGKDFGVFSSYIVPGFDINKTFEQISKEDFQGAISQAEGFSDRYLRTLAILASVKNCEKDDLVKAPKPKMNK